MAFDRCRQVSPSTPRQWARTHHMKQRLGVKDPSWELLIPRRGARWDGGGKIRLGNFSFPGEAVTELEVERSVSRISYSQEVERSVSGISHFQDRRLLSRRRKDPSREFLISRRWKDPSWEFLIPTKAAHWAGGGKIRLRNFSFPGELTGLEVEDRSLGWRWKDPSQEFLIPRRGGHWAGGGKIRKNFSLSGEAVTGLEVERSVSRISHSQERRSLGWRWKDPSRQFLIPRRGGH